MKIVKQICLINQWTSEQGICIEIEEQSKHVIKGTIYLKAGTLIKSSFSGIISIQDNEINFVSLIEICNPFNHEIVQISLNGRVDVGHINEKMDLCVCLFLNDSNENIKTVDFELYKTSTPVDDMYMEASDLIQTLIKNPKFLN